MRAAPFFGRTLRSRSREQTCPHQFAILFCPSLPSLQPVQRYEPPKTQNSDTSAAITSTSQSHCFAPSSLMLLHVWSIPTSQVLCSDPPGPHHSQSKHTLQSSKHLPHIEPCPPLWIPNFRIDIWQPLVLFTESPKSPAIFTASGF